MSGNKNDSFVPDDDFKKMFELPDLEFNDPLTDLDDYDLDGYDLDDLGTKKEFDRYLARRYNELENQLSKKEIEINDLISKFRKDLAGEVKKMMN